LTGRSERAWLRQAALSLLLALLIAAPGAADSPWGGTPLDGEARLALCGAFVLWVIQQFFPPRRALRLGVLGALAALIVVKAAVGAVAPTTGWAGQYTFHDTKGQPHPVRFFWRFQPHDYRVDRALTLDWTNFNLHFFNDLEAFGYPPYSGLAREHEYPLHVQWRGYLHLDDATAVRLTARANGQLDVSIDGQARALDGTLPLTAGTHRVDVGYRKGSRLDPIVDVYLLDGDTGRPLRVTPGEVPGQAGPLLAWLTGMLVAAGALVAVVATIAGYIRSGAEDGASIGRIAGIAATLVLIVWTGQITLGSLGQTAFLRAGGDPLLYASDAREILLGGPLVLRGRPLGQAAPFYFYPFYPYVMASVHALVGDDVSAIFLLNGLAVSILPLLFWWLGWGRLGAVAVSLAFVALVVFIDQYWWTVAAFENPSLTDLLFTALVFVALNAMLRAYGAPQPWRLVLAGLAIGLCSATRPSVLTLIGMAPLGLWAATRAPLGRWIWSSAWLMFGVFLALLPFTTRNLVAAGQFVVLVNSWIQIPYFLVPPEVTNRPGGVPGLVEALGMAWAIFQQDPAGTLWVEARKVLFTLGFTSVGPPWANERSLLWILPPLFVASAWLRRIPPVLLAVLVTFTISHLFAMVIAAPWTFAYKSIVPLHLACLFGAAYLLDRRPAAAPPPAA
jgi:hypothetical protein